MKKYLSNKFLIISTTIFYLISILSSSILVYFVVETINALNTQNKDYFKILIIVISVLTVIFIFSTILYLLFKNKLNFKISILLNKDAINKISSLSAYDVKENKEGKYLSWIKDRIPEIRSGVFNGTFNSVLSFLTSIVTLVVLFFISWKFALIGIGVLTFSFIIPAFLSTIAGKIYAKFLPFKDKIFSSLYNVFNGFKILYYIDNETKIIELVDKTINKIIREITNSQSKVIKLEVFNGAFQVLSEILFIFICGLFIFKYNEPIGIIFIFPSFITEFAVSLRYMLLTLQNIKSYKQYLKEFIFEKRNVKDSLSHIDISKIEIKNLSFSYENKTIFKNFNLTLFKGKRYALIGKSGSGKSTLINILLKQITNYEGEILINNINIKQIDEVILKNSLTYLSNLESLFNDTLYNNVSLWEENKTDLVKQALNSANLNEFELNYMFDEKTTLSTGQKQKINLARHFYRNKSTLFLDESMSNLDKNNAKLILKNIFKKKDLLFLNSTHHLLNKKYYDEIIDLNKGKENE